MKDIINGRCGWCGTDDKTLFEFLVLKSAQAGLSWITILRKREDSNSSARLFATPICRRLGLLMTT